MGQVGMTANRLRGTLAVSALAVVLLCVPTAASAANPPACTSAFPTAFLVIDGTTVIGNTRWVELRQNPHANDSVNGPADPEYPFPLTIAMSQSGSHTYSVHDYAKDQFPATFGKGETAAVSATYVEDRTTYDALGAHSVRCTRTITASLTAPPRPKKKKHHHHHHHHHHQGQDQQNQDV
jgi:hypothetical protein